MASNSRTQNIHKARGYSNNRGPNSLGTSPLTINSPTSSNNKSLSTSSSTTTTTTSTHNLHIQRNISLHTNSLTSLPETQLTAKPHAFSGAVLNPKQARELTPKQVLHITHTLGNYALDNANNTTNDSTSNNNNNNNSSNNNNNRKESNNSNNHNVTVAAAEEAKIQYTVWITEAWRCLGWAEPSAALFWEMATMYHTLHVAARSIEVEETEMPLDGEGGEDGEGGGQYMGIQRTLSQSIPPILSCGSSASMESVETKKKEKLAREPNQSAASTNNSGGAMGGSGSGSGEKSSSPNRMDNTPKSPPSPTKTSPRKGSNGSNINNNGGDHKLKNSSKQTTAASAKELPVWLVGMYLLLHCEEGVFLRNVSGEDAQRFDALMAKQGQVGASPGVGEIFKDGKAVDFGMLLMQPSMSMRYVHTFVQESSFFLLLQETSFILIVVFYNTFFFIQSTFTWKLDG